MKSTVTVYGQSSKDMVRILDQAGVDYEVAPDLESVDTVRFHINADPLQIDKYHDVANALNSCIIDVKAPRSATSEQWNKPANILGVSITNERRSLFGRTILTVSGDMAAVMVFSKVIKGYLSN